MSTSSEKARKLLELFSQIKPFSTVLDELNPDHDAGIEEQRIPGPLNWSEESRNERIAFIHSKTGKQLDYLSGKTQMPDSQVYKGNIEQFIGLTQVPTGIIGPLRIHGTLAQGNFYVPMATTEGALVASYNRGARAASMCGGIISVCLTEGVQRSPVFKFRSLFEVGAFLQWILTQMDQFKLIVGEHSNHAQLQDMRINMEGNTVVLIFEYTTGDAAGQNMVTICTNEICKYIIKTSPITAQHWFIEGNYSGDKKATAVSFTTVRGKKVTSEAFIKKSVIENVLRTTAKDIAQYWQTSSVASVQSGSIGIQGHFANGLTAIFLATGQDVACVAEAYVGITRMEVMDDEDLYVSVTLPSLMVGTIGGGTGLPTQRECLELMDCTGPNSARKFAEICGATVLAGELSIASAMASGDFSDAHKLFRRKK